MELPMKQPMEEPMIATQVSQLHGMPMLRWRPKIPSRTWALGSSATNWFAASHRPAELQPILILDVQVPCLWDVRTHGEVI